MRGYSNNALPVKARERSSQAEPSSSATTERTVPVRPVAPRNHVADYGLREEDGALAATAADNHHRPNVFGVLFGAGLIRVADDGSLTLFMLPAGLLLYLRSGARQRGPWGP